MENKAEVEKTGKRTGMPGSTRDDGGDLAVERKYPEMPKASSQPVFTAMTGDEKDEKSSRSRARMRNIPGEKVIAFDLHGNIIFVSDAATNPDRRNYEDMLGSNIKQAIAPEFHDQIDGIIEHVCCRRTWSGLIPVIGLDGEVYSVLTSLSPVVDKQDRVVSIIGVCTDTSDTLISAPSLNSEEAVAVQPLENNIQAKPGVEDGVHTFYHYFDSAVEKLRIFQKSFQAARQQLNQLMEALSQEEQTIRQLHLQLQSLQYPADADLKTEVIPEKYRLEVYCLGIFRVCSVTKQIKQWQSNRAKSVFEYLVSKHTAPVSRDILMGALWPDYGSKAAANNLKTAIHDLRQILSPLFDQPEYSGILFSREGYSINPEIELLVDAEEFERLWSQGKHLERDGKLEEAMRKFEKAESLYQGDFLEDSLYEDWTISRRETLKDIYLLIINKLADYSMNIADYENCIAYCHKILEKDNCREDTYRMLMSSYSRLGQKNIALRWYENCRQILNSELGSPPSKETVSLLTRLKRDENI
ncbi:MAG: PAS domain-containing protein [Dehalococcoidales bacterium]|nr:PAS domain-containing protein [Dehalococcoidales bacterium]